eukprot:11786414-Heterocapsa_arctica.AAC.1
MVDNEMLPGEVLLLQRLRHEVDAGRPRVRHREIQREVRGRLARLLAAECCGYYAAVDGDSLNPLNHLDTARICADGIQGAVRMTRVNKIEEKYKRGRRQQHRFMGEYMRGERRRNPQCLFGYSAALYDEESAAMVPVTVPAGPSWTRVLIRLCTCRSTTRSPGQSECEIRGG